MNYIKLLIMILSVLIISCSKEEFSAQKITDNTNDSTQISHFKDQRCSNSSTINPQVDFLFLWDNSGSQGADFITPETKNALSNLIFNISSKFDYRALLAPLIGTSTMYLIANNAEGITLPTNIKLIPADQAPIKLETFPTAFAAGSKEQGLARTLSILESNKQDTNGIFRKNGYTFVVLMSNGNDGDALCTNKDTCRTDPAKCVAGDNTTYYSNIYAGCKEPSFTALKTTLETKELKFFSIISYNDDNGNEPGDVYKRMSQLLGSESYDITNLNFNNIFDGVNASLQEEMVKHVYDHWPITENKAANIDKDKITVTKNGIAVPMDATNGFTYVGWKDNHNTRIFPTADPGKGEPFSAYMIKLNGTAKVTFPECMIIETSTPSDYYGYIHLATKPHEPTIYITIDGVEIPKSTTNGWEYVGYLENRNVKIESPVSPNNPGLPALSKTGYFLKLYGTAIYSNNSKVSVQYQPSN